MVYTAVTVYTIFTGSGKNTAYWWLQTCSTGLQQSERTTLAVLLLPLVAITVICAPPPLGRMLLGCRPEHGASAQVRLLALRLPCPHFPMPILLPQPPKSLFYDVQTPALHVLLGGNDTLTRGSC